MTQRDPVHMTSSLRDGDADKFTSYNNNNKKNNNNRFSGLAARSWINTMRIAIKQH